MKLTSRATLAALALLAATACGPRLAEAPGRPDVAAPPPVLARVEVGYAEVTDTLPTDPELEAMVAPFRSRMQLRTEEVLGVATGQLRKQGEWESTLGNFSADAMLHTINRIVSPRVHVAVTNNGGLRAPIQAGPITVGLMYELMPFENMLVVETFTGAQLEAIASEIVAVGGEPMAGMRITVDDEGELVEVTVDGMPPKPNGEYRLVTSDYLANGNGAMPTLWTPQEREDLAIPLRDAFIRYVREREVIEPMLDGRIGWVRPPEPAGRGRGGRP